MYIYICVCIDQDPSLLIVGLGFVNTNLLRCRLVDTAVPAWIPQLQYVIYIYTHIYIEREYTYVCV